MEELKYKSWPQGSGKNNNIGNIFQLNLPQFFKMLSVALSRLVLICKFFEKTYFCHLRGYLLACFYEEHIKFHISHLFSLGRFRTVETIPICKSKDDGADMLFRNS